jgi:hypothetical protein
VGMEARVVGVNSTRASPGHAIGGNHRNPLTKILDTGTRSTITIHALACQSVDLMRAFMGIGVRLTMRGAILGTKRPLLTAVSFLTRLLPADVVRTAE